MENLYSYTNYAEAYYNMRYNECITIGKYLLKKLKDKESKILLDRLNKLEYKWNMPKEELTILLDTLLEIKTWLMVWENWL